MPKKSTPQPRGRSYRTGYGRPPKHAQFKPGQSGNPKGRPKRSKSIHRELVKALSQSVSIDQKNPKKRIPLLQIIAKQLVHIAAKGDTKSIAMIIKTLNEFDEEEEATQEQEKRTATFSDADEIVIADLVRRIRAMAEPDPDSQAPSSTDKLPKDPQ